jgi:hypothetical protein
MREGKRKKANVSGLLFRTGYLGLITMTASVCCINLQSQL